jgi:hypothetical protein
MSNKQKAALITSLIMGVFPFVFIACYYWQKIFVKIFVGGLGIIAASALFYAVYVAVLHHLDVKHENKIGGPDER